MGDLIDGARCCVFGVYIIDCLMDLCSFRVVFELIGLIDNLKLIK